MNEGPFVLLGTLIVGSAAITVTLALLVRRGVTLPPGWQWMAATVWIAGL